MTRRERKQALEGLNLTDESLKELKAIGEALGEPPRTPKGDAVAYIRSQISKWRKQGWPDKAIAAKLGAAKGVGDRGALALIRVADDEERAEERARSKAEPMTGEAASPAKSKASSLKGAAAKARSRVTDQDESHMSEEGSQPAAELELTSSSPAIAPPPSPERLDAPGSAPADSQPEPVGRVGDLLSKDLEGLLALSRSKVEPKH